MFNLWKIQLKIKCQELYDENIKLKELLDKKYYITFNDEDELVKYVEDYIDKYVVSGHITSKIKDI
tara:strand:+ start:886 stop:1083 length:198 start_codon:yes stop_codon:yes gene_type:complete